MKNVAIVYDRELSIGGVESHLLTLFKYIDHRVYRFTLIAPISKRVSDLATSLGVTVIPVPAIHPVDFSAIRRLKSIFNREKIDLVHIHSPAAAVPARLAARWCKLPVVVTVHAPATNYYGHRTNYKAALGRFLYIQLDRILNYLSTDRLIYVSRLVREASIQNRLAPGHSSQVIPNGIDVTTYQSTGKQRSLRELYQTPSGACVIAYVGRLDELKGLDILLDAIAIIKRTRQASQTSFQVWLIGAGPQEDELRQRTTALDLTHQVLFMGFQEAIPEYLSNSDIFVLPSLNEAMSISILEALAAGLPCVVTEVGDNSDLVENGRQGFVVPPNSVEALAHAIRQLLDNPTLVSEMKQRAMVKAQNYSSQKMVNGIQQVYTGLLMKES